MRAPLRVYVLLFNAGTENEGIHTVQIENRNKVLMFEDEDDATRFALMLEAQDFPTPTVEAFDSEEIQEFCQGMGYDCELIEQGQLAIPPEQNVEEKDWTEEGQLSTPELKPESESESNLESSELDEIRRRLEGLL